MCLVSIVHHRPICFILFPLFLVCLDQKGFWVLHLSSCSSNERAYGRSVCPGRSNEKPSIVFPVENRISRAIARNSNLLCRSYTVSLWTTLVRGEASQSVSLLGKYEENPIPNHSSIWEKNNLTKRVRSWWSTEGRLTSMIVLDFVLGFRFWHRDLPFWPCSQSYRQPGGHEVIEKAELGIPSDFMY